LPSQAQDNTFTSVKILR